jgi:xanthine dehydrogenase accessory factor
VIAVPGIWLADAVCRLKPFDFLSLDFCFTIVWMNDNEKIARIILELLGQGSSLVLASIVSLAGSSPRHSGTKMVIGADGKSYGTIGGSLLEATAIKESQAAITESRSRLMRFSLSGKDAQAQGMICGGTALVMLDYIAAGPGNLDFFQHWQNALHTGKNFFFLTLFKEFNQTVDILGHAIMFYDGQMASTFPLSDSQKNILKEEAHWISQTEIISLDDSQVIIDPIRKLKTVYCFGAGHVAVPTAHLAALVGFRVVVLDDRAEYASLERFPEAARVQVIKDFNQAMGGLEIDADSFIIILTRGHQYDREVLEQALKTGAGYVGMISSRRKKEAIYQALIDKGIQKEELARVHSPIGIPIGGETPEEIAVSIVAELIRVRADQQP